MNAAILPEQQTKKQMQETQKKMKEKQMNKQTQQTNKRIYVAHDYIHMSERNLLKSLTSVPLHWLCWWQIWELFESTSDENIVAMVS